MSPVVLGSTLGAAALAVSRGASQAVGNGLSFAAQLLQPAGERSAANEPKKSAAQTQLDERIEGLRNRIRQQLLTAGIRLSPPAELTSDGGGGIAVAAHPQQGAIEQLLGNDVLLERDFSELASDYGQSLRSDVGPGLRLVVGPSSVTPD